MFHFLLLMGPLISVCSAETVKISETHLLGFTLKGSPQLDQIEAAFLNAQVERGEKNEKFAPEIFGRSSYSETNERAIIEFQPIFTPIKQAQLGVRRKFPHGIETSAYVVTDQRTARSSFIGKLDNITTTTLAFTAQVDIWKDLFGKMSKAELESSEFEKKRAELEKEIQLKAFQISLRRIYWSLVANRESTVISQDLLQTAKRQLEDSKLRFKSAIAEADEVARYEAQLASREGTILYLEYQRETLFKQLRNLLPELVGKELELDQYDLDRTLKEVLSCTETIRGQRDIPYSFTKYDETVTLLRNIRSNNAVINSQYDKADVKLFGTVKSTGIGSDTINDRLISGNYGDSLSDQTEQNRTGYEVGINFTMPLGTARKDTRKVKELYDDKRLKASIDATETLAATTHTQLLKSIGLLSEVIRTQKESSLQLSKRLALMKKKYSQARVTVDQLVLDQDALLNSELTTIETQLQILNTLFDYLVIFTDTPCAFNKL